ncbi:phospholipase [Pseudomonas sp. N40(2020)]|uniref:phospholipase n=1 Tax=Pseudomonas sp. N40(2020) TaxID=2767798 RepID=UPI001656E008|nr:phospholipase [Pseudomonas sp. N40(2020)]MBC8997577.1 phospholipase [Pseudomonas sp. N40(2020)]
MHDLDLQHFQPNRWMAATPPLDNLSLFEMTLPGTHNAGCDWEASYSPSIAANWAVCQDVPFYSQLNRGARALDLRLVYDSHATGLAKFRFFHDKVWSSRTLEDLIRDLKGFLERSYNEFIVLDFHELRDGDTPFDFKYFNDVMLQHLGEYIIPEKNKHLSLGELKNISRMQRLLVATPSHSNIDWEWFCHQVIHKWAGNAYVLETLLPTFTLQNYLTEVMKRPPSRTLLWSLSAAIWNATGPQRIYEKLDAWFDPANSDWAQNCNIINFDFIKNSNIVLFCQQANLQKAIAKSTVTLHPQHVG